jgi:translation machinery-associated protein 16
VQKLISKKRGKLDALHENSRDSKRLQRASAREDKLARAAAATLTARLIYVDRISFFQERLKDIPGSLCIADVADLVKKYIHRDASEIEQLQQGRRKGRPPSKREEAIVQRTESEEKEFMTGFWMPDLIQDEVRTKLLAWNGIWSSLSAIKFIRLTRDGVMQSSAFPPTGLS